MLLRPDSEALQALNQRDAWTWKRFCMFLNGFDEVWMIWCFGEANSIAPKLCQANAKEKGSGAWHLLVDALRAEQLSQARKLMSQIAAHCHRLPTETLRLCQVQRTLPHISTQCPDWMVGSVSFHDHSLMFWCTRHVWIWNRSLAQYEWCRDACHRVRNMPWSRNVSQLKAARSRGSKIWRTRTLCQRSTSPGTEVLRIGQWIQWIQSWNFDMLLLFALASIQSWRSCSVHSFLQTITKALWQIPCTFFRRSAVFWS